jgi:chromosome segregation ATPase
MTIPLVVQGLVEIEEGGKVFELDSPKGSVWLESVGSFRFEPVGDNKPYTVRKEAGKGGDYWYGYRKQNGKLHKKYIGKSSEINTAKLEEIAEALNTPPQPRVTDKVTEVTERNTLGVTDIAKDSLYVTPRIVENSDRLTALELQVQALQESLEALRSELPGKFAEGDSSELPNPNAGVTDNELQIELGNLKAENEALKVNYAALLESSTVVADNLRKRVRESEARLEVERADREEIEHQLSDRETEIAELRSQLATERTDREEIESELADLKQNSEMDFDFAGKAGDLVNWLRKTVGKALPKQVTIKEVRRILEGKAAIIEES